MCVGPLKVLCHWGPLIALGIIKCICLTSLHCLTMWWPPSESLGGFLNSLLFTGWNGLVLYNFFSAMFFGPGYVPMGWKPDDADDAKNLQYCNQCKGYKAPRSHHCRRCNRCVLKMDHHCPWINNCCGHKNHANFTMFLFFAVCGSCHASVILSCSLYRSVYKSWFIATRSKPIVTLGVYGLILGLFALGLAIGVIIAVGFLWIIQMKCIMKNETAIESWIITKANRPRAEGDAFVYPYNLGWKENLRQVFWQRDPYDDDDGIIWPVKDGCNQYTLTIEQLNQKVEKKVRMREYVITEKYGGSWFPITKGLKVCCTPPCSDEPRIPLDVGDQVLVSRWKTHWLYGEKVSSNKTPTKDDIKVKGWFPRRCAIDIINKADNCHLSVIKKINKKKN